MPVERKNPLTKITLPRGALKKPDWLRIRAPSNTSNSALFLSVKKRSRELGIATVCAEAMCPNIGECWGGGTATFMIMGDTCTRACKFCNVNHGVPKPLDKDEPTKLANAIAEMGLKYAVITCVDRDDLQDGGAEHFSACIRAMREKTPALKIEILSGDFQGDEKNLSIVLDAGPHVFAHNIETVERLQKSVRDFRANYKQSLGVLEFAKKHGDLKGALPAGIKIRTKSSIMVGLGETQDEVVAAMKELRKIKVDYLTIGQYLRPTAWNLEVKEYISPELFEWYRKKGLELGFLHVASGPFVRSSYRANEAYKE